MKPIAIILGAALFVACAESKFVGSAPPKSTKTIKDLDAGTPEKTPFGDDSFIVVEANFASSKEESAELTLSSEVIDAGYDFTLIADDQNITDSLTQINRPAVVDTANQGAPANVIVENFSADAVFGAVDIVVVVDDSPSMRQEQAKLAPNLQALLSKINDASWQIAVMNTSGGANACHVDLIRKTDGNLNQVTNSFANTINGLGIQGSANERGILAGVAGLTCRNWLQQNSSLAVLILSDEENCSRGCTAANESPPALQNTLRSLRVNPDQGKVFAIHGENLANGSPCNEALRPGPQYVQSVQATGGITGSICEASYEPILESISQVIAKSIPREFVLANTPLANTVTVAVNGQNVQFAQNGRNIVLNQDPPSGAQIRVTYSTQASTIVSAFAMSKPSVPGTLEVLVQEVPQDPGTYNQQGQTITFNTPPAGGAAVKFKYKDNSVSLATSFPLSKPVKDGTGVTAIIEGNPVPITLEADGQTLTFDTAPSDGAAITVSYKSPGPPRLVYNVTSNPVGVEFLGVSTKEDPGTYLTGITIFDSGLISIDPSVFAEGQVLTLHTVSRSTTLSTPFVETPVPGSLVLPIGCNLIDDGAQSGEITIDCPDVTEPLRVLYRYLTEDEARFTLPEAPQEGSIITVTLNDTEQISEYVIEGDQLVIYRAMDPETKIHYKEIKLK